MAVCIGAQFKTSILGQYFGKDFNLKNITENIVKHIETDNYKYKITISSKDPMETIMGVSINKKGKEKETTRYYRVYNVEENGKNHIILNTFAPGGNHHPAKEFWEFEKKLLRVIKENENGQKNKKLEGVC